MNRATVLLAFSLFAGAVHAAAPATASAPASVATAPGTLVRDLGRGLIFHRVAALPAELPAADGPRKRPIVLDLRYTTGDAAAGAALVTWLKAYATLRTPVFVLANVSTDRPVRHALAQRGAAGNVLVIGVAARDFVPDLAVQSPAAIERQAYDALANGAEPSALLVENTDKARNDEASLSHDRSTDPAADAAKDHPKPPPIDAALQRTVHLHRALVALKKI
jgi:hypothetical protein